MLILFSRGYLIPDAGWVGHFAQYLFKIHMDVLLWSLGYYSLLKVLFARYLFYILRNVLLSSYMFLGIYVFITNFVVVFALLQTKTCVRCR